MPKIKTASNETQEVNIKLAVTNDEITLNQLEQQNADAPQPITNTGKALEEKQIASLKQQSMLPIVLMLISGLAFSSMSFLVKLSGSRIPAFEIVFVRSIVQGK